jgi:hypothetical protein
MSQKAQTNRAFLAQRNLIVLGVLLLAGVIVGCMNLSFGERTITTYVPPASDGVPYTQEGTLTLRGSGTKTVYYPVPYASIPNLTLIDADGGNVRESEHFVLEEQRPDYFCVRNASHSSREANWVAKGVRPAPLPEPPAPAPPARALPPPDPVPIEGPRPIPVK